MKNIVLLSFFIFIQYSYAQTPTGDSDQYFCDSNATIADIEVSGNNILWFFSYDNSGTPLESSLTLVNGSTYYAFEGTSASSQGLAVTVHIVNLIPAPIGNTPQDFCSGGTFSDLPVFNTVGYSHIFWFTTISQNTGSEIDPDSLLESGVYYAFQGIGDCIEPLEITVNIEAPMPAPTGEIFQVFCMNDAPTLNDLIVFNTDGYDNIYWFSSSCQNDLTPLNPNTVLYTDVMYYAFQGISSCCPPSLEVSIDFMTCLGIDNYDITNFNMQPNPVKNSLRLYFKNKKEKSIIIYTVLGSKVYENTFYNTKNIQINTSDFNNGIYFISTKVDNKTNTKRFVKN